MKSQDKCSVEVTASLLEKSSRYGDVSNGGYHIYQELWEAVIVCSPVKNFRAFNFRHLGRQLAKNF